MNGEELALLITATAISISQTLSDEDIELLAVVFTQLADTFATLAVVRARKQSENGAPPSPDDI